MKTAVSIPDPLFQKAERKARKLGVSRSKLYAQALQDLLDRDPEQESELTRQLNDVHRELDSAMDPDWRAYQARTVAGRSVW